MTAESGRDTPGTLYQSNAASSKLVTGEKYGSRGADNTAESLTRNLDKTKEGLMPHYTEQTLDRDRELCIEFLALARTDLDQARLTRLRHILMARRHGLSNQAIGDALGISEAAVRSLMKRNLSNEGANRG